MVSLAQIADAAVFMKAVAPIYENSPWIAERTLVRQGGMPFESITAIDKALWAAVCEASHDEQLGLLNAHPDLAGKAAVAGELTDESTEEQKRAGLGQLTVDEMSRFTKMNHEYKAKFGFSFILAICNANKRTILGALEHRLKNSVAAEQAASLAQVRKIAWMRLRIAVQASPVGRLLCQVLDSERCCPASKMRVALRRCGGSQHSEDFAPFAVGEFVVDSEGELASPVLQGVEMAEGVYEFTLSLGEYYAIHGVALTGTPLQGEVPIRFSIDNPESLYQVQVLCRPSSTRTLVLVEPVQQQGGGQQQQQRQPTQQWVAAPGQPSATPFARL